MEILRNAGKRQERRAAGAEPMIGAMLHSLAFGTTLHYISHDAARKELSRKQLEMTADVMAHSLLYWTRDLYHAGFLQRGQMARDDRKIHRAALGNLRHGAGPAAFRQAG